MSDGSILLELDGSAQTRYAAEIAWSLAKVAGARVDAQHVVDSLAAWDFLAFDVAGFIGSGPYFEAHESMRECLIKIGSNLIEVYLQIAQKNGVEGEAFLDDGATIREICTRAKDYDLVVMGHQSTGMGSPDEDQRKLPRRSVTETLTFYLPKPLLLVQDRCRMWTKARILIGDVPVPKDLLRSCVAFINGLSIEPNLRIIYEADPKKDNLDKTAPDGLRAATDLASHVQELGKDNIDVRSTADINEYLQQDAQQDGDVLLVVPVWEHEGALKTSFNMKPEAMVRYLNHPAILFWTAGASPEPAGKKSKSVSTAV